MIVVADTSPLRYLILIEHVHVLPALFGEVIVPPAVVAELTNERTPLEVRTWLADKPEWLRVQTPRETLPQLRGAIDDGEREAIALAVELRAAVLIDDRNGRRQAEALKCPAVGTLAFSPTPPIAASPSFRSRSNDCAPRTSAWTSGWLSRS